MFDVQIFQTFKKYEADHHQRFPPKGEALEKRWEEFRENQRKLHEQKKAAAEAAKAAKANPSAAAAASESQLVWILQYRL